MTVVSVAVEATKFLFGMCHCMVDSDVGMGDFSLVPGILHVCGHAHVRSHVCPDMDGTLTTWSEIASQNRNVLTISDEYCQKGMEYGHLKAENLLYKSRSLTF